MQTKSVYVRHHLTYILFTRISFMPTMSNLRYANYKTISLKLFEEENLIIRLIEEGNVIDIVTIQWFFFVMKNFHQTCVRSENFRTNQRKLDSHTIILISPSVFVGGCACDGLHFFDSVSYLLFSGEISIVVIGNNVIGFSNIRDMRSNSPLQTQTIRICRWFDFNDMSCALMILFQIIHKLDAI